MEINVIKTGIEPKEFCSVYYLTNFENKLDGRPDGWTNTSYYVDPYVTHMDQTVFIFSYNCDLELRSRSFKLAMKM